MEHFLPVLLSSESDYLCPTSTRRGHKCEGEAVCATERCHLGTCARLPISVLESRSRASYAAVQSPAPYRPSHSVTFHYHRVLPIKYTV